MRKSNAVTVILATLLALAIPSYAQQPSASTGVQGIIPFNTNGNNVLPVVNGSLKPAINGSTAQIGVDTSNITLQNYTNGLSTNLFMATPPAPTLNNEFGVAIITGVGSIAGTGLSITPKWQCVPGTGGGGGNSCNITTPATTMMYIQNVSQATPISWNVINSFAGNWLTSIVEFTTNNGKSPTLRGGNIGGVTVATSANTLSGSTVMAAATCISTNCIMSSPATDSQGNVGVLVSGTGLGGGCISQSLCGQYVYVFGPSSAAAETVTFHPQAGSTVTSSSIVELSGLIPANPNRPATQIGASNNSFAATPGNAQAENDPGGIFVEAGGFNYQTTLTITQNTTIPLWNVTQHGVFKSCTLFLRVTGASGTTPTLNTYLQDGPDLLGWNDHISLPQATAAGAWEGITPIFTATSLAAVTSGAVVTASQALTPGSVVAGPMAAYGQLVFVVGGTTPSFTVNIGVTCQ